MNLSLTINHIQQTKATPYADDLSVSGNELHVSINFSSYIKAHKFARAWSYEIQKHHFEEFYICVKFLAGDRYRPIKIKFSPGDCASDAKEGIRGHQRPEKRLPFF